MTEDQLHCDHKWSLFRVAFIGDRWQCVKCDATAPLCFWPKSEDLA